MSQTDDGTMKLLFRMQAEICQTLAGPTRPEILIERLRRTGELSRELSSQP